MMTSHCERLLEVSSRLWDRTWRSCVIHIMTVDSAGFSSHGASTTVDTSDRHTRIVHILHAHTGYLLFMNINILYFLSLRFGGFAINIMRYTNLLIALLTRMILYVCLQWKLGGKLLSGLTSCSSGTQWCSPRDQSLGLEAPRGQTVKSWSWYKDGLPACRRSAIQVLTGPGVD